MNRPTLLAACLLMLVVPLRPAAAALPRADEPVTFRALLAEMTDPDALARFPSPAWSQKQASSYNRESIAPGKPGWFADSDGTGFIREETSGDRREFVAMEHDGPGCLTRLWAPFFFHDYNDRTGPVVRIYIDGSPTPAIEAGWIELLTNNDWPEIYGPAPPRKNTLRIPSPLARFTARAGDLYLPIPFARSCRVTFDRRPFYFIINWRAYAPGARVEPFTPALLDSESQAVHACAQALERTDHARPGARVEASGSGAVRLTLPPGPGAIRELEITLDADAARAHPALLRTLILTAEFDGEQTVRCPLGDFFGSPNTLNTFSTLHRAVRDGVLTCRWTMPFKTSASIRVESPDPRRPAIRIRALHGPWAWDDRSMHFGATWRADEIRRGDTFADMNFLNITGTGVLVGDQLTVLNPTTGWWGEGDEKIYIDSASAGGFPDHFGTGTEDYYGWAGGVNPTHADVFSHPFLANIAVGSFSLGMTPTPPGATRGFNILARHRGLDTIPFRSSLVFDMEASPGVDQRKATDLLGYSSIAFWYARPGATQPIESNQPSAARPLMSLEQLEREHK